MEEGARVQAEETAREVQEEPLAVKPRAGLKPRAAGQGESRPGPVLRLHDWRSLSATLGGKPLVGPELFAQLTRWRAGKASPYLRVYAACRAPLVPLSGPAFVVWEGCPGRPPRGAPPPRGEALEAVSLILPAGQADALRRLAAEREVSVADLVGQLVRRLEDESERRAGATFACTAR